MTMTFRIRPDTRLNEAELAVQLKISRTPLREALNRLVAEGLLAARDRGFSGRKLAPGTVAQLYEARAGIEVCIIRLACTRAAESELTSLERFIEDSAAEREDSDVDRLVQLDVGFHERRAPE
jgi:DNA-binding GntR family transcriptional regulator